MTREQRLEAALSSLLGVLSESGVYRQAGCGCHEDVSFPAGGWSAVRAAADDARQALATPAEVESVAAERIALLQANYTARLNAEGTARLDALTAELRELVPRVTPGDIAALAQMRRVLGVDASAEGPPPGDEAVEDLLGALPLCDEAACRAPATQHVLAEKSLWRRWQWCDDHAPPDAVAVDLPRAPLVRWLARVAKGEAR